MSKTTTMAQTRNTRSANAATERSSHHLINGDQLDDKRHSKDSNFSKTSKNKQGSIIDGNSRVRNERRSTGRSGGNAADNHHATSNGDRGVNETVKSSTKSANGNQSSSVIPQTKLPIEQFYAQKGIDYRRVRKNCRMNVNGEDKASGTNLHVDFFQPPEGYTVDDLPDSQGQGVLSQHRENPISPAVLIAAQPKKDRAKIVSLTPDTDPEEMIRRIQMGRRKKDMGAVICSNIDSIEAKAVTQTKINLNLNDTFPDDSLNDSDLIIASQQVENDHIDHLESGRCGLKDVFKRDKNGNSKEQTPPAPLTSTPVPNLVKNLSLLVGQTPRITRGLSRTRNRSGPGKANQFDKSISDIMADNEQPQLYAEGDEETAPRKLLKFDESPIKKVNILIQNVNQIRGNESRGKCGEFNDDSGDEIFSQMEIPDAGNMRIRKPSIFESSSDSIGSGPVTQLMNSKSNSETECGEVEMDSYLDDDALDAIAKLEAIHCTSGGCAPSTKYISVPEPELGVKEKNCKPSSVNKTERETPRTRARRQGLSRLSRSRTAAH